METTNTIKGIEVIAYKRGDFQYEIGKTYKAELRKCRFLACLNPRDLLDISIKTKSRYYKVKLSGDITKCDFDDTQVTATEMTILEEITDTFNECIKTTEWWKNNNVLDLLYYQENFAKVQRGDGKYNYIDNQGKLLSDEWFVWAGSFYEGFAGVHRTNGESCKIDKNGKIVVSK